MEISCSDWKTNQENKQVIYPSKSPFSQQQLVLWVSTPLFLLSTLSSILLFLSNITWYGEFIKRIAFFVFTIYIIVYITFFVFTIYIIVYITLFFLLFLFLACNKKLSCLWPNSFEFNNNFHKIFYTGWKTGPHLAGIYLLKVNNRNTRTRFKVSSKWTYSTRCSSVSIVNFELVIPDWAVYWEMFIDSFLAKRGNLKKNRRAEWAWYDAASLTLFLKYSLYFVWKIGGL